MILNFLIAVSVGVVIGLATSALIVVIVFALERSVQRSGGFRQ